MSTLIKGGRIITAADDYVGDVYVDGERISMLGESLDVDADRVIDASGKYVLPGCVDPHTHLDMPFGGTTTIDDVTSGQTAAAFGGTTCHVDFCIQAPGSSFAEALDTWHGKREGKQIIDMGFHIAVTDLREGGSLEELARLPEQGITSYKLFMAYKGALMVDDETLFRTMEVAADTGALVMVHAENGDAIDVLVKQALAAGQHGAALPRADAAAGDSRARRRTARSSSLASRALRCTWSTSPARRPSTRSRAPASKGGTSGARRARSTSSSTTRTSSGPDFEGAKYVYTPPPRDRENQEILWHAVRSDILSAVSTDHCAFLWDGQKSLGRDDFSKIPNGGPGLENRLHMIHEFGVRTGRISLNRMVELLSTNPAKLFGLYPRKGTIAPGSDADIVDLRPGAPAPHHRCRRSTRRSTTTSTREPRSPGRRRPSCSAGTCSSSRASSSRSRVWASSSSGPPSGRSSCPQPLARRPAARRGAGHLPPCPAPSAHVLVASRATTSTCARSGGTRGSPSPGSSSCAPLSARKVASHPAGTTGPWYRSVSAGSATRSRRSSRPRR